MRQLSFALVAAWGASAGLAAAQPAPAVDKVAGDQVFEDRCVTCHNPQGGGQGPSLVGVVGRKAGSLPGFSYTTPMKTSGITWTPALLDRFLSGPSKLVPGTAMRVIVSDPTQRRDLIAYLASQRKR
jgi:cytochrome c